MDMEALPGAIPVASSSSSHRDWPADLLELDEDDDIISSGMNRRRRRRATVSSSSRRRRRGLPARVACAVVRGVITFVFAAAGAVLGAITGALIGLATESGLVRGAGVGAISGAVVSMEVVESSMAIWRSHESGIWSVLYVLDVIWSLLTGRLVREKVDPAVQSAVESQMNAADHHPPFGEPLADMMLFETSSFVAATGLPAAAIEALPATTYYYADDEGGEDERAGCSVCLQDLEPGEAARRLPGCAHTFHLPCIDAWLLRHASCPLCRRAVEALAATRVAVAG